MINSTCLCADDVLPENALPYDGPETTPAPDTARQPWQMTHAEFERAVASTPDTIPYGVHTEDWGGVPRGAGKRCHGMVRGCMAAHLYQETYPIALLPDAEEPGVVRGLTVGQEYAKIPDPGKRFYRQARCMGLPHADAMRVGMEAASMLPVGKAHGAIVERAVM